MNTQYNNPFDINAGAYSKTSQQRTQSQQVEPQPQPQLQNQPNSNYGQVNGKSNIPQTNFNDYAAQPIVRQYQADIPRNDQPYRLNDMAAYNPFVSNRDCAGQDLGSVGFNERKGFIVKVYSLISLQLFITFAFCILAYYSQSYRHVLYDGGITWVCWVCLLIAIIVEIVLFCFTSVAKQVPYNYIALLIFTLAYGTIAAAICGQCFEQFSNGGVLVIVAALLTLGVTVALTIYAAVTDTDFTVIGGLLWIVSIVLLIVTIFSLFFRSMLFQLVIAGFSTILYGVYLIYDTQLIIGDGKYKLSIDDYIIAALLIYLDIMILFFKILEILMILFGKK